MHTLPLTADIQWKSGIVRWYRKADLTKWGSYSRLERYEASAFVSVHRDAFIIEAVDCPITPDHVKSLIMALVEWRNHSNVGTIGYVEYQRRAGSNAGWRRWSLERLRRICRQPHQRLKEAV